MGLAQPLRAPKMPVFFGSTRFPGHGAGKKVVPRAGGRARSRVEVLGYKNLSSAAAGARAASANKGGWII